MIENCFDLARLGFRSASHSILLGKVLLKLNIGLSPLVSNVAESQRRSLATPGPGET